MLLKVMLVYSPVAVMSLLLTCTVISVDDGLLRASTSSTDLRPSLTLYFCHLNCTATKYSVHKSQHVLLKTNREIKN